jgi:hypothetical protein
LHFPTEDVKVLSVALHGCETWDVTRWKEHGPKSHENKVGKYEEDAENDIMRKPSASVYTSLHRTFVSLNQGDKMYGIEEGM